MRIREMKKRRNRARIIESARESFMTRGYGDTSIEEIAKNSEIGVGTVYNYFQSKADLLVASFFGDIEQIMEDKNIDPDREELTISKAICEIAYGYTANIEKVDKDLLREINSAMNSNSSRSDFFKRELLSIETSFLKKTSKFVEAVKRRGRLEEEFRTMEALKCVYSSCLFEIMRFVYDDLRTVEDLREGIRKQVEFVFSGK